MSPRRLLAGMTGVVLIVVGFRLQLDGIVFDRIVWIAAYALAGVGLTWIAIRPDIPFAARATIAVVAAIALAARTLALIFAIVRFPETSPATLVVAALAWPLIGAYIVVMLAYWPQLGDLERPGARRHV